jgi:hypothetical protein
MNLSKTGRIDSHLSVLGREYYDHVTSYANQVFQCYIVPHLKRYQNVSFASAMGMWSFHLDGHVVSSVEDARNESEREIVKICELTVDAYNMDLGLFMEDWSNDKATNI